MTTGKEWHPGQCPVCLKVLVKDGLLQCHRCSAKLVQVTVEPTTLSPEDLRAVVRWLEGLQAGRYRVDLQDGSSGWLQVTADEVTIGDERGTTGWSVRVEQGLPVDAATGKVLDFHRIRWLAEIKEIVATPRR